jgi:UDP-N-acetylglucosamine--N-acetylmuramyl-(pentapeptide) pyrophosphoryl-undecaprenol N-acetylglucosamine transferase
MIGYYAHHVGMGHVQRASCIARHLDTPVTLLSSRPPADPHAFADFVQLARDDSSESLGDPTAQGALHWVPLHHPGLRTRMAQITAWVQRARPTMMVVDVSVEVNALARLLGIPVVTFTLPGNRGDPAHALAYTMAERIIAAWPQELYDPIWLHPYVHKTAFVGAFCRFDDAVTRRKPAMRHGGHEPQVLVLNGAGGSIVDEAVYASTIQALPQFRWRSAGVGTADWCDDIATELRSADVIVTHGGQNALAEVATFRVPAVVIPQVRPHGEQAATAEALRRSGIATVLQEWPATERWPDILATTLTGGGDRWARWASPGAAQRAADVIAAVVDRFG